MLRVFVKRTKMMISREHAGMVKIEIKFPCTVCRKDVVNIPSSARFAGVGYLRDVVVL